MVRLNDGAEILVRRPGSSPATALAWNARGSLLALSDQEGDAGIFLL
jgi:hypothetical protein